MRKPRKLKEQHPRLLWRKTHVAQEEYRCSACADPIMPGDEYYREVWARGPNIWVHREHTHCEDPDDRDWLEGLEELQGSAVEAIERAA
jgi:hypothetical protein